MRLRFLDEVADGGDEGVRLIQCAAGSGGQPAAGELGELDEVEDLLVNILGGGAVDLDVAGGAPPAGPAAVAGGAGDAEDLVAQGDVIWVWWYIGQGDVSPSDFDGDA